MSFSAVTDPVSHWNSKGSHYWGEKRRSGVCHDVMETVRWCLMIRDGQVVLNGVYRQSTTNMARLSSFRLQVTVFPGWIRNALPHVGQVTQTQQSREWFWMTKLVLNCLIAWLGRLCSNFRPTRHRQLIEIFKLKSRGGSMKLEVLIVIKRNLPASCQVFGVLSLWSCLLSAAWAEQGLAILALWPPSKVAVLTAWFCQRSVKERKISWVFSTDEAASRL